MRWNRKRSIFKNHRNCLPLGLGVRSRQYGVYATCHWNWMNGYWMFWIGRLRGARSELARWAVSATFENDLSWFNRIFLLFEAIKSCVFQIFLLKETKTHYQIYFYYNLFIIEKNQWKFEQNQAKNKEVTALWNLAISRGRYSKWWQVVDNSPYVLYMKFHVFPLFWWLRQFPSLKSRYDKQGCILHGILWSRAMKTHISKEN